MKLASLDVGDAPDGHDDVGSEDDEHEALDPLEVERVAQLVAQEHHASVVLEEEYLMCIQSQKLLLSA